MVVMLWLGTVLQPSEHDAAARHLKDLLGLETAPEILGSVTTRPTPGRRGTGGRIDVVFRISGADVGRAAVSRLAHDDLKWASDADPALYTPEDRALFDS